MRFCSFSFDSRDRFGFQLREGELVDLPEAVRGLRKSGLLPADYDAFLDALDLKSYLSMGREAIEAAKEVRETLSAAGQADSLGIYQQDTIRLLPPIPNPGKIIAIGLNYKDHALEQGGPLPDRPLIFAKFTTSLIGPGAEIRLPSVSQQVDPEAELCVVILEKTKGVSREQAPHNIAGYTVGNDVSARDLQFSDKQWVRGKSCDTFAPLGPFLATQEEVPHPHKLDIELRVNGELRQSSNTENLIFDSYDLVSFISETISLETGDIIFTGTPAGVGVFRKPPVFLESGDLVEVTIEKVGTLTNPVISAEAAPD